MQVAMSRYRMMEKSDRDDSQAISAEQEFQTFLLKYPQSPLVAKAEQDLRNVQEVLADGEYRAARFYYLKPYYPAAAARLFELSERYPLYSHSDEVLWMLGDIYMRAKKASKSEDDKNHWGDLAASCYSRVVKNYPLSPRVPAAKAQLAAMGMPVPLADPIALARMKQDQLYAKQHHPRTFAKPVDMIRTEPDVYTADRYGKPNLDPPDDIVSAKDVLSQGAPGPVFDKAKAETDADANGGQLGGGDVTPVETAPADSSAAGMTAGAQIIAAPASAADAQPAGAAPSPSPDAAAPLATPAPAPQPAATSNPGASTLTVLPDSSSNSGGATVSSTPPASSAAVPAPAAAGATPVATATSQGGTSTGAATTQSADAVKADKADPKTESSSKKKKGFKKIIP
jgi:outer membrane protein assembly factor BamD